MKKVEFELNEHNIDEVDSVMKQAMRSDNLQDKKKLVKTALRLLRLEADITNKESK